jgi:hypothetical protein
MKVFLVLLALSVLCSCFSHSEEEYALQAEKMCKCVQNADSVSNLDTLKKLDFSELNFARCASTVEVDPTSKEFITILKKTCPSLNQRHADYLEKMKKGFNP